MLKRIISMMLALFMVLSACPIVYMSENEAIETLNEAAQEGTDTEDAAAEDAEKTQDPADESNSLSQNEESEENAEGQETAASDEANQNPSSDYMQITADAVYHKADITAPEGLAVVEAFVIDEANCDAVQLTLTALPSLSDGETLAFCGLVDDAAEAILENVQVGDTVAVALNAFNGFALMKKLAKAREANPIEVSKEEKNEVAPADPVDLPTEGSNETGKVETTDGKSDKSETDTNSDNPDPEEEDEEKKDESEDKTETILKKSLEASDGKTYQLSVSYSGKASFPNEAELRVSEIAEAEKSYSTFINKAAQAVYLSSTDFSYIRLFDLSILGADGKAYPLDDTVSVKIDLLEEADTSDLRVVTIGNRTEEVDAEVEDATVSFEADESASVFAIVNVSLLEQEISASLKTAEGTKSGTLYENDDILLTGKMPSMGIVEAEPVSIEIERQKVLAAYNIKIYANRLMKTLGISWQPSDGTIKVQVKSAVMDNVNTVSVYHIADGESAPELVQERVSVENGAVSFAAESFSVYVVVAGPSPVTLGWHKVNSVEEFEEHINSGLYVGHSDGYYFTDTIYKPKENQSRTGILKTQPASSIPTSDAVVYFFESTEGNKYYAYWVDTSSSKHYVKQDGNSLSFVTERSSATAFTITRESDYNWSVLGNGGYYWNQQGNSNGKGFAAWADNNDGSKLQFWYPDAITSDVYGLDNKTYGIMHFTGGIAGRSLMANEIAGSDPAALEAEIMLVRTNSNSDKIYAPVDSNMTEWTFRWAENDKYYISANGQYLQIGTSGLSLGNTPQAIQFIPGSGVNEGKFCLKAEGKTLTFSGKNAEGFSIGGTTGNEWLHFVELFNGDQSQYLRTYSASKVSASAVPNGASVIVYTRVWNGSGYDFYAIKGDGTLLRCYENGDSIQWLEGEHNTLIWDFTEYWWEGTTNPNGYYELYNQFSRTFLAPQVTEGQLVSADPIGLNMRGRGNGYYQTTIAAWDTANYSYVALKTDVTTDPNNPTTVSGPLAEAEDFYFAIVEELPIGDDLNSVPTVDHKQYGITMRLFDFDPYNNNSMAKNEMSDFLGNSSGGVGTTLQQGLLSTNLGTDGYPTVAGGDYAGHSLREKYAAAEEVNHLFIKSTYSSSGYYEFDSSQNFASLKNDYLENDGVRDFLVYRELGTCDSGGSRPSLKHGQFFPYNDIQPGHFATINGENKYTAEGQLLPDSDPRKNEQLYLVDNVDYLFAVEIEATFTMTPDGHDAWGNDIIYEFTGDDDFWLYVDDELVIDLGGIHSAVPGRVNYATGDVFVNGSSTTLRTIYESNYRKRNPTASDEVVSNFLAQYFEGTGTIFKEYTNHTMRIFYMERGGGASNLHMRFNLASVKPGSVLLSKELTGVENQQDIYAEYPFQIYYKTENGSEYLLSNEPNRTYAYYKDSINPVRFESTFNVPGVSTPYQNVYILKPGETAEIDIPDVAVSYRIVECGVNPDVYDRVSVNGNDITGESIDGSGRKNFGIGWAQTSKRPRVNYNNHVAAAALCNLTITKELYDIGATTESKVRVNNTTADPIADTFEFRLSLSTEYDADPELTNMQAYHVKNPAGEYCAWNAVTQGFESLGKTNFADLTTNEKNRATFYTSIRGSISKIPVDYTVEIRDLLAGTKYRVEERPQEIPDGYLFLEYNYNNNASGEGNASVIYRDPSGANIPGVVGTVVPNVNPQVVVQNKKVWAITVNKTWSDKDYMSSRGETYFAVFTVNNNGTPNDSSDDVLNLVNGTIRQLPYGNDTVKWVWDCMETDLMTGEFDNYTACEVTVSGAYTVNDGIVSPGNGCLVDPIIEGGTVQLNGTTTEGIAGVFHYSVGYTVTMPNSHLKNVVIANVRNDSPVVLRLTDMQNNALDNAQFVLKNSSGTEIGSYTTDAQGLISNAYLMANTNYTLTQTAAKNGYQGLASPITFRVDEDGIVTVIFDDPSYYTKTDRDTSITPEIPASLTVKNRPYRITIYKRDKNNDQPIPGVVFSLHMRSTTGGSTAFSQTAMPGYESLTTNDNGEILLSEPLRPGTYWLKEESAPGQYDPIVGETIIFTIDELGIVSLEPCDVCDLNGSINNTTTVYEYTLTVENEMMIVAPTDYRVNSHPFILLLGVGAVLVLMMYSGKGLKIRGGNWRRKGQKN